MTRTAKSSTTQLDLGDRGSRGAAHPGGPRLPDPGRQHGIPRCVRRARIGRRPPLLRGLASLRRVPATRLVNRVRAEAALASRRTEHVLHIHHTPRGDEHVQVELNPVRDSSGEIRYLVERMQSLPTARAAASSQGLIGRSPRFREMLELAARVAPTRDVGTAPGRDRHRQGNGHAPHSRGQPALRSAPRRRRLLGSHRDAVRE